MTQRIFTQDAAGGRYKAGDVIDRPEWWWRQWGLHAVSEPAGEVMRIVAQQLGQERLEAATGEPAPPLARGPGRPRKVA